ncbi:amino acid ABC transporter permease (plasmid) [Bosea vestrisii]|uniref:amino acid ABC transporter permease n=1 Tax=Bosea vestrisii TaxID=151416 RepID=UPI0024DF862A|nr:amino acid ABC transporter permease [Bosea vestrisii]WID99657.1 amino acid ABC transporter permease [Bosea vestrisii]
MNYVFQFGPVWKDFDLLLGGAWLTLKLSFVTLLVGLPLGALGAVMRRAPSRLLRGIARGYVEVIRNTPFLVQLLLVYLALPAIGLRFTPQQAALFALIVNFAAYATEIIRAGIESVPEGQREAGRALGLSKAQIFFLVVLKPSLCAVYPALCSQFVLLVLTSSVVSVISAEELTAVADRIASRNFRTFEVYLVVTAMYLAFSVFLETASSLLYRHLFRWREAAR